MCNPPLASLDLICAKDDNLTNSIIDIVLPFSGSFTYLNVFTDESQGKMRYVTEMNVIAGYIMLAIDFSISLYCYRDLYFTKTTVTKVI